MPGRELQTAHGVSQVLKGGLEHREPLAVTVRFLELRHAAKIHAGRAPRGLRRQAAAFVVVGQQRQVRLDLLIEAAVSTQYAEFGRRGQHVTTDIPPGLPRVIGSEEGLGRAVAALIDNAIKYSPSGAQIHVAVRREGGSLLVSVADSGPGLDEAELAQVFDPFYRAAGAERAGVSGRGLGLTIAKAVIEQHDGQIWAVSEPGRGSTFAFRLPCGDPERTRV